MNEIIENALAREVLAVAFGVHTRLGPGLLESVYEVVLAHELRKAGFKAETQRALPIRYEETVFEVGFRADVVVNDLLIVEIKSVERLRPFTENNCSLISSSPACAWVY